MDVGARDEAKRKSIEVFCCYAREDQRLLLKLKGHLIPLQREGLITLWADVNINAGMEWEKEIDYHLYTAQIILLLISSHFIASEYCYSVEMQRAMERHERGEARVIPIILRPISWQEAPFGKLQALPANASPIIGGKWHNQDEAFYAVAEGIRDAVKALVIKNPVPQVHSFDQAGEDITDISFPPNSRAAERQHKEEQTHQAAIEQTHQAEKERHRSTEEAAQPAKVEDHIDVLPQESLDTEGSEDIDRYIGSKKALRSGSVHQELTDLLVKMGVRQKTSKQPSDIDILERYRSVPLHAIFLYTWAHKDIASYISANWGDLDTLSGDVCDIHQSVDQFKDAETAYDYIEKLDILKTANFKEYSQLPGMFFWDNHSAWEYISFGSRRSDADITNIVQVVFEEIYKNPTISSVTHAKKRLRKEGQLRMKEGPTKKAANWRELLVILLAFVVVMSGIGLAAYFLSPFVLWLVLIAGLLFLVLIIVYLKGPAELSETNFVRIIFRVFDAIPILSKGSNQGMSSRKSDKVK